MILEDNVNISLHPLNIKYYTDLGYYIPKVKGKVNRGTCINVKIQDLKNGSNALLTKVCDKCGEHKHNQRYSAIIKSRNKSDDMDLCKACANIIRGYKRKNKVDFKESLEYFAKLNNMEYLLKEYSYKNKYKTREIRHSNPDNSLWNCRNCGSEYKATTANRTRGRGCPFCVGLKVNETNSLWGNYPEIARLLINKDKGHVLSYKSSKKEDFKCGNCGEVVKNVTIFYAIKHGIPCKKCGDGFSYPEKFVRSLLKKLNHNFIQHNTFTWSRGKIYDFYIDACNCIIEVHGAQHYKGTAFGSINGRTFEEEKENDRLKEKLAKDNGIEHYIVIDCRKSELEWIKENVLNSKLSELFDLSEVDWLDCHKNACNSLVQEICDLWRSGLRDIRKISDITTFNYCTVRNYLKKGSILGLCDYDPSIYFRDGHKKNYRKIVQFSKNGEYIKTWNSIKEAKETLNIKGGLSYALGDYNRTSYGYRWMYFENYNGERLIED